MDFVCFKFMLLKPAFGARCTAETNDQFSPQRGMLGMAANFLHLESLCFHSVVLWSVADAHGGTRASHQSSIVKVLIIQTKIMVFIILRLCELY